MISRCMSNSARALIGMAFSRPVLVDQRLTHGALTGTGGANRPFPSCVLPQFQSESSCETI